MCLANLEQMKGLLDRLIAVEKDINDLQASADNEPDKTPLRRITDEEYEEVLRARKKSLEVQLHELGYSPENAG